MVDFLATGEIAEWLKKRGLLGRKQYPLVEEVDYRKLHEVRWFGFGRQLHLVHDDLADVIANLFKEEQEILLFISDWALLEYDDGRYVEAAGLNTFYRFRQALGDAAMVWDKPGHVFHDEQIDMQSLLRLVLALQWDVSLVSGSGGLIARVFDTDICAVYAADPALLDTELLARLDGLTRSECD